MVGPLCRSCQTILSIQSSRKIFETSEVLYKSISQILIWARISKIFRTASTVFPVNFNCVHQGIHTHWHVAKSVSESATRSQALFSTDVYCILKNPKQQNKQQTNKKNKIKQDIYISTFLDKQWAGFFLMNSVNCSSSHLDNSKGSILKTKPIFLFQGRSEPWQADLGGPCRSSLINNCWLSRDCYKQSGELQQGNYCTKIS